MHLQLLWEDEVYYTKIKNHGKSGDYSKSSRLPSYKILISKLIPYWGWGFEYFVWGNQPNKEMKYLKFSTGIETWRKLLSCVNNVSCFLNHHLGHFLQILKQEHLLVSLTAKYGKGNVFGCLLMEQISLCLNTSPWEEAKWAQGSTERTKMMKFWSNFYFMG